jgi:predicted transcriptional regulator YdeE
MKKNTARRPAPAHIICCRILARIVIVAGTMLCLTINVLSGDKPMSSRVVQLDGFTVIGIATRTNNAREASTDGIIGKQWARLMQEDVLTKIPNKLDHSITAVYTDYENDHSGEYTFVLGAKVSSSANVPEGMIAKKIPEGRYAVFTSEKGPGPKVVPELWMKINSLPKSSPGGDRVYRSDFEIYDERAADPQNLQMDVYIGIR